MLMRGWLLIAGSYIATLWLVYRLYMLLFSQPADLNRGSAGWVIGVFMVLVPYVIAGLYVRTSRTAQPVQLVLWLTLVPLLAERAVIYGLAALLLHSGGDGSPGGVSVLQFIQGDVGLPYFTEVYMLCAVISVGAALLTALPGKRVHG